MAEPRIDGTCDPRFDALRVAFTENFTTRGEIGAALAVAGDGRIVADLWGGAADETRVRPWTADTLVDVFSVGKAMAALTLLRLVERGLVDLDAPVARYWPAFAAHDKDGIPVRMLLTHQAGLPGVRAPLPEAAIYEWDRMTAALAAETPWWPPGTAVGYHVNSFGFLVGEVVRRVTGDTIGTVFRREIAGPLGADFFFGVGPAMDARIADYVFSDELFASTPMGGDGVDESRRALMRAVYMNPPGLSGIGTVNTRAWRAVEVPSTNGHASARGIAAIYAPLAAGGGTILSRAMLAEATTEMAAGHDVVLDRPSRFGLGFQLNGAEKRFGPGARTFGHFGAGGSLGFADPERGLAFGYTMNLAGPRWQNPRNRALIDAVYAAL